MQMSEESYWDPCVFYYTLKITESRWKNPWPIGNLITHTLCCSFPKDCSIWVKLSIFYVYHRKICLFSIRYVSPTSKWYSLCWYNQKVATCPPKYNKHLPACISSNIFSKTHKNWTQLLYTLKKELGLNS